tara:strand:+ start:720 stop:1166 length:447 start_codon:yes stop_codon:yes gene_type:complete
MIVVIQRSLKASVEIQGETKATIENGIVILLGIVKGDKKDDIDYIIEKLITMRIFDDSEGKMNLSLEEVGGSVLVVSQFTLCADISNGRRPSFSNAKSFEKSKKLYNTFILSLRNYEIEVESGEFGSFMNVKIINNGPATFILDSKED